MLRDLVGNIVRRAQLWINFRLRRTRDAVCTIVAEDSLFELGANMMFESCYAGSSRLVGCLTTLLLLLHAFASRQHFIIATRYCQRHISRTMLGSVSTSSFPAWLIMCLVVWRCALPGLCKVHVSSVLQVPQSSASDQKHHVSDMLSAFDVGKSSM